MHTEPGYITEKLALQTRLRRIEGQVRGLQRLVDEDTYCIDILTQISASTKALESVALLLLDQHLQHCLTNAGGPEDSRLKLTEASKAIARLVRS
ncbi:DNA-binding FrmR family transcriptional regulator [Nocardioides salarius]|uniref:DNA-binding FrmR family transcriptional regulator n=1 Tax=Nocardioides salarius TaxID=374513 RepID=A0ABS2MEL6_9ACTN|nr:metal-sensitive transcriptional regulator [Nocardioides salarius]MBM7509633.1 DNA-binding FrmR family transcriptional regulator [Nocardioides salarius]